MSSAWIDEKIEDLRLNCYKSAVSAQLAAFRVERIFIKQITQV